VGTVVKQEACLGGLADDCFNDLDTVGADPRKLAAEAVGSIQGDDHVDIPDKEEFTAKKNTILSRLLPWCLLAHEDKQELWNGKAKNRQANRMAQAWVGKTLLAVCCRAAWEARTQGVV
jgi:hypothetical protein